VRITIREWCRRAFFALFTAIFRRYRWRIPKPLTIKKKRSKKRKK